MAKKTYVLDTSVYLTDANAINSYGNNDILVPLKVLEEIDNNKKRQDSVGANARDLIRILDSLRQGGDLRKGVRLGKGKGIVFVRNYNPALLPNDLDPQTPDNQIIGTALTEMDASPKRKVVLISRDINMRIKCDAVGIPSEDYNRDQVVSDRSLLYTGVKHHLVDEQIIDRFYSKEEIFLEEDEVKILPNQFVMLVSNSSEKKSALAKFSNYHTPLKKIIEYNDVWGVRPRNKEQDFAMNLLMDPSIEVISLVGKAGSGKTLCAIAAGLQQTIEGDSEAPYRRLIISRPIQPLGRDIGFLPGTLEEKMAPWISPIRDNLEFLMGDKRTLDMYVEQGIIEIEALTYIRGRSISNAYIIIDEAQNLTSHEIKTILTRVGEGTKLILTGDVEQIDNIYVDEVSNGLSYVIEKFKKYELSGHMTLLKGERSRVATLAAKIL
tara:strand:+ start:3757 stop:5070 length:1314 start_codon:yes stop_codon:yes gene_type:complete